MVELYSGDLKTCISTRILYFLYKKEKIKYKTPAIKISIATAYLFAQYQKFKNFDKTRYRMPIFVKDYSWQQTDTCITIKVSLKGALKKDTDLLTSEKYIKASYYPYIFELFLCKPIDDTKSKCFITDKEIIFELCKIDAENWEELELNLNKSEKLELKKEILEEIQNRTKERSETLSKQRSELKRLAVREQIALDTKFREKIESVKKAETEKALKNFNLIANNKHEEEQVGKTQLKKDFKKPVTQNYLKQKNCETNNYQIIPQPRKSQVVSVSFTTREFPTPSRESQAEEELEWLSKQVEARRISGFNSDDLSAEERNPQWLKEKGDEFFNNKNYLAAISAYSLGIKLSKNLVSLYINRSAAHMGLGNLHKTIEDCSTALELMVPVCQANLVQRAKCLARRGAALAKLGLFKQAADECEAALKLQPNDEQLKSDLFEIKARLSLENQTQ